MFQRAAASFDECSTAGIFLTGLRSQNFQSRLLFHSDIVPLPSSSESLALPSSHPVPVAGLKGEYQPFPLCFFSLCLFFPLLFPPLCLFSPLPFLPLSNSFSWALLCCSDLLRLLENWELWGFEVLSQVGNS